MRSNSNSFRPRFLPSPLGPANSFCHNDHLLSTGGPMIEVINTGLLSNFYSENSIRSLTFQIRLAKPISIAGVTRRLLWIRTKL